MLSDTFTRTTARRRATALALAFGVVAGGAALAAGPSLAIPEIDAAASTATISVESAVIAPDQALSASGAGFTPGALVYVQITDPSGIPNYAYGSAALTADESGAVVASLDAPAEGWAAGAYEIGFFESDAVKAATEVTVDPAAVPTETATPTSEPTTSVEPTASEEPTASATETAAPTEAPAESATEAPAPTLTDAPTVEPTATPTETATPTAEPTDTATPTPEPTDTPAVSETPAAEAPAPAPGGAAGASETPADAASTPTAAPSQEIYTTDEAAQGVEYSIAGFAPDAPLELVLTLPDGSVAHFDAMEAIVPDATGAYQGVITKNGEWSLGAYQVVLQTKADEASLVATATESASFSFEVVAPGAADTGPGETGASQAQAVPVSGGSGSSSSSSGSSLAGTGADLFGPAGIALATIAAGAGIVLIGRRVIRRESE